MTAIFHGIVHVFITVLNALYALTGSFGLSLILLAVIVKILLYGPTQQQYKSMKDLQKIQPEMQELQKKYKDKPDELNKAMMDLYQRHGVNPLGGCLPLIIQLPILYSIWGAIMGEPKLFSNAYFLWIHPGPLQSIFPHLFASSLADRDLPLILFYGLTMYMSQQLTPTQPKGGGGQKYLGVVMSVVFSWMMWKYSWPCALILYWSVFSFLTIIQQSLIMRAPDTAPAQPVGGSPNAEKEEVGGK